MEKRDRFLYILLFSGNLLCVCIVLHTEEMLFIRERPGARLFFRFGDRLAFGERGKKKKNKIPHAIGHTHIHIYIKREGFGTIIPEALAMAEKKGKILKREIHYIR